MASINVKFNFEKARLIILPSLLAAFFGFLLSNNSVHEPVHAFSSGPPAGYTRAPGEEPEACAECHVTSEAGTGTISITAPQTYIPGQTYPVTVTHTNADPTRRRWGFQLTVLDSGDEKAGNLQSTDAFTQVLDNQGPGGARQYIEHTSVGTFVGQQGGASWTFNWTAPPTDVGTRNLLLRRQSRQQRWKHLGGPHLFHFRCFFSGFSYPGFCRKRHALFALVSSRRQCDVFGYRHTASRLYRGGESQR